jgi:hypothetical protein
MLEEQETDGDLTAGDVTADDLTAADLAQTLFDNPDEAANTLSPDEQKAYRESQESVVEARRHAETREGLLRIN